MKPILVHCHIFYPEMWTELKACIKNIRPFPFRLFVTLVENHKAVIDDIKESFDNVSIEIVENRGYDIGPFVYVLNKVDLEDYSYIVKLHTKRDIKKDRGSFRRLWGAKWRNSLLYFLKTPEVFSKYIEIFEKEPKIGMQARYQLLMKYDFYDPVAVKILDEFLKKHNLPKRRFIFVAGTMFIARAFLFKDIQRLNLDITDFDDPKGEHKAQLAHAFERFFGYIVYKNDLSVQDGLCDSNVWEAYYRKQILEKIIQEFVRFFYQSKNTRSGYKIIKILKIPVYRKRVM